MTTWAAIKSRWSDGWKALQAEALATHQAAIQAAPSRFSEVVQRFVGELTQTEALLQRLRRELPSPPTTFEEQHLEVQWVALNARYHELAAGYYAEVEPAEQSVGAAPLVVAGLVVGVAAIAWSIAAYEYAVNLREQTALAVRELEARVAASDQGRVLPPSTLPQPAPASDSMGWLVLGGLALAAGAAALPIVLGRGR